VEQGIKQAELAVNWIRLCCYRFRENELRLWLSGIAHNLGEFLATVSVAERDWIADEFLAVLGQDQRPASETRTVSLAAMGRGAAESETVYEHAKADCTAATVKRVANQEKRRTERSGIISSLGVRASSRVTGQSDLRLTPRATDIYILSRRDRIENVNSGQ
jgi:hypothetical protein